MLKKQSKTNTCDRNGTTTSEKEPSSDSSDTIGTRIARVSEVIGGRAEAAKAAGVSGASLQRYIRNDNMPPFDVAARLCNAAGVSMQWLDSGEGPMLLDQLSPAELDTHAILTQPPESEAARRANARREQRLKDFSASVAASSQHPRLQPEIVQIALRLLRSIYGLTGATYDAAIDPGPFVEVYQFLVDHNGVATHGEIADLLDRLTAAHTDIRGRSSAKRDNSQSQGTRQEDTHAGPGAPPDAPGHPKTGS